MQRTRAVNVKHEECDVYMGRAMPGYAASPFQNIFKRGRDGTKQEVLTKYRAYLIKRLEKEPKLREALEKLRGKKLGCWCKPHDCHVDIIVELLDGPEPPATPEEPAQGSLF